MKNNDSNISASGKNNNSIKSSKSTPIRDVDNDSINPFYKLQSQDIRSKPKCNLEVNNPSYLQPNNQDNSFQNNINQQIINNDNNNENNNENKNNIFQPNNNVVIIKNNQQNLDQQIKNTETKLSNQNEIINEIGEKINQLLKGQESLRNEISELFNKQKKYYDEQLKALEEIVNQNMANKNISNNNNSNNNNDKKGYRVSFYDHGTLYNINCNENEKVSSLISKFKEISASHKKFFFKNEELNPNKSCKEAGLPNNSVIDVKNESFKN